MEEVFTRFGEDLVGRVGGPIFSSAAIWKYGQRGWQIA
jgi:hypothetical protein